jgi:hypothetical protein
VQAPAGSSHPLSGARRQGLDALGWSTELGDVSVYQRVLVDRLVTLVEPRDRARLVERPGAGPLGESPRRRRGGGLRGAGPPGPDRSRRWPQGTPLPWGPSAWGSAHFLPPADDAHTLISRAQSACASARAAGGPRVVVHHCPGETFPPGISGIPRRSGRMRRLRPAAARTQGEGFRLCIPADPAPAQARRSALRGAAASEDPRGCHHPAPDIPPRGPAPGLAPGPGPLGALGRLAVLRQERDAGRPTRFLIHQTPESLATPELARLGAR